MSPLTVLTVCQFFFYILQSVYIHICFFQVTVYNHLLEFMNFMGLLFIYLLYIGLVFHQSHFMLSDNEVQNDNTLNLLEKVAL